MIKQLYILEYIFDSINFTSLITQSVYNRFKCFSLPAFDGNSRARVVSKTTRYYCDMAIGSVTHKGRVKLHEVKRTRRERG